MGWRVGQSRRRREERHNNIVAEARHSATEQAELLARVIAQAEASRLIDEFEERMHEEKRQKKEAETEDYNRQLLEAEEFRRQALLELDEESRRIAREMAEEMGVTLGENLMDTMQAFSENQMERSYAQVKSMGNTRMCSIEQSCDIDQAIENWLVTNGSEKYLLLKNKETGEWYVCEKDSEGNLINEGFLDEMEDPAEFLKKVKIIQDKKSGQASSSVKLNKPKASSSTEQKEVTSLFEAKQNLTADSKKSAIFTEINISATDQSLKGLEQSTVRSIKQTSSLSACIEEWRQNVADQKYLIVNDQEADKWYFCECDANRNIVTSGYFEEIEHLPDFAKIIKENSTANAKRSHAVQESLEVNSEPLTTMFNFKAMQLYNNLYMGQKSGMKIDEQRKIIEQLENEFKGGVATLKL